MSIHLDLEEQEQLAQLKAFWQRWGKLITAGLFVVVLAYAGYNAYQYWQRSQAQQAAALFDLVEAAVQANDADRVERSWADMRERYGSTIAAQQAALLATKVMQDKGKVDAAKQALQFVVDKNVDAGYVALARLRLSSLQIQGQQWDAAMQTLKADFPASFAGLVADRLGDIHAAAGRIEPALVEYQKAHAAADMTPEYRALIQAKAMALGKNLSSPSSPAPLALGR